jgi:hypothetical protein
MVEDDLDIKKKVEDVLRATDNLENRAAKMDVDDLLACVAGAAQWACIDADIGCPQSALRLSRRGTPFRLMTAGCMLLLVSTLLFCHCAFISCIPRHFVGSRGG